MQAAECAHNSVVDFCLQTTSTVVKELQCRSPFRSLPFSLIHWSLTQIRCRTVAVHRHWYWSLWASTTLAVESPTDLFVASHWLERSSSQFSVTLLVFNRADHSTSQVLTTSRGFYFNFYWRLASKSLHSHPTSSDWSRAMTSHATDNSDARSIQISSQNICICCMHIRILHSVFFVNVCKKNFVSSAEKVGKHACKLLQCNKAKLLVPLPASINGLHNTRVYAIKCIR